MRNRKPSLTLKESQGTGIALLIFALFGALLGVFGCATVDEEAPTRKYSRAERSRMLVEIANGAILEGDPTGALIQLKRAEQEDDSLPELHHTRALAFYAKHDLNSAIEAVKKAVSLKPNYADANNSLGKLLIEAGKFQEAIPYLESAAKEPLYRDSYKAWTNLGILKYKMKELSLAHGYFDQAIQSAPARACIAYYYRGHIKLQQSKLFDAIRDYDQATRKLCAKFGDAQLALGIAYQQNKQYDLARKTYLEVQKRFPNTQLAEQAIERLKYLP